MERETVTFESGTPEETLAFGRRLADRLHAGDVVGLYGDLGSGKTLTAQGIARGLDVTEYVTSPSFTLMQVYQGRLPVYHFDFYRLGSGQEVEDLGVDDYLGGDGVCLVEWPEIGEAFLPEETFTLRIERLLKDKKIVEGHRRFTLSAPAGRGIGDFA